MQGIYSELFTELQASNMYDTREIFGVARALHACHSRWVVCY